MNIKEIIKSWKWRIVRAGLTQKSLAAEAGVSRVFLNTCISGKANPSVETFDNIESALRVLEEKENG